MCRVSRLHFHRDGICSHVYFPDAYLPIFRVQISKTYSIGNLIYCFFFLFDFYFSRVFDLEKRILHKNHVTFGTYNNCLLFFRATEGGLAPDAAAGAGAGTDGIVGGPRTPQQIASQKRLQATQAQVDEVVDIMKTNVEKVLERDQKLSELDDRAGELLPRRSSKMLGKKSEQKTFLDNHPIRQ